MRLLRLGKEKKEDRKKPQGKNMMAALFHKAAIRKKKNHRTKI